MKKALSSLELPENIGCIVRTAALDQTREELERDYLYLMRLYENIETLEKKLKAPALIYKESNLVIRSIRDYFTTDMDEVLIDDPEVFREAREFFEVVMPDHAGLVKLHQERRPIFSRYQIEEQIETISRNKVALPSGGSIVIDTTEALVAIDVNSGKMAGESNVEATATRTNLEAAEEVARQLRLRDLGGLIVIDFIDMRDRKHNRQVEERLKDSTARDKARITIGHISQFGMLEMSRQRIKPALTEGAYRTCPHCQGAGRIRSVETLAISVLRRLHAGLAKGQIAQAEAQMAREVASYLLNEKREELVEMERRYQADIQITGRTSFLADQVEITLHKREKEKATAEYVEAKLHQLPALGTARPAELDEEEEPEGVTAGEAAPGTGKKRRRKRKRKGEGEIAEPAAEQTVADASTEPETTTAGPAEPLAGEVPTSETAAKKKRRRRGRKKGGGEEAEVGSVPVAAAPDKVGGEAGAVTTTSAALANEMPPAAVGEEASARKKRRRRGRKKPGGPTGEAVAAQATAAQPDTGEAAPASIPPVAEEQPKPARKPRKKPAAESDAAALFDAAPQAALAKLPDMAPPAELTAPVAKVRAKRGARQQPETTAPAGAAPPVAPIAPATVNKPKRQRAPRLKAPGTTDGE
jgi:ribonuclease E